MAHPARFERRQASLQKLLPALALSDLDVADAERELGVPPEHRIELDAGGKPALDPVVDLACEPAYLREPPEVDRDDQRTFGVAAFESGLDRAPHVVALQVEPGQPFVLVSHPPGRLGGDGE